MSHKPSTSTDNWNFQLSVNENCEPVCVDATLTGAVNLEHGSRVSVTFVQKTVNPKTHQPVSFLVFNYKPLTKKS